MSECNPRKDDVTNNGVTPQIDAPFDLIIGFFNAHSVRDQISELVSKSTLLRIARILPAMSDDYRLTWPATKTSGAGLSYPSLLKTAPLGLGLPLLP
ncbi:MAG: hypothetical protein AAF360_15165, partial [Pseudomonadota bacterium]